MPDTTLLHLLTGHTVRTTSTIQAALDALKPAALPDYGLVMPARACWSGRARVEPAHQAVAADDRLLAGQRRGSQQRGGRLLGSAGGKLRRRRRASDRAERRGPGMCRALATGAPSPPPLGCGDR
jgi:hypothetical protein